MGNVKIYCAHDELIDIHELRPNPQNHKTHPVEQIEFLAGAILDHGWRVPLIVSKRNGLIIDGHARLKAAELLGLDKVPVDKQDFANEAEEKLCLVADCLIHRAGI